MRRIVLFDRYAASGRMARGREMKIVTSDSVCLYINVRGTGTPACTCTEARFGNLWLEEFYGRLSGKEIPNGVSRSERGGALLFA
jgi:hypothetical protein